MEEEESNSVAQAAVGAPAKLSKGQKKKLAAKRNKEARSEKKEILKAQHRVERETREREHAEFLVGLREAKTIHDYFLQHPPHPAPFSINFAEETLPHLTNQQRAVAYRLGLFRASYEHRVKYLCNLPDPFAGDTSLKRHFAGFPGFYDAWNREQIESLSFTLAYRSKLSSAGLVPNDLCLPTPEETDPREYKHPRHGFSKDAWAFGVFGVWYPLLTHFWSQGDVVGMCAIRDLCVRTRSIYELFTSDITRLEDYVFDARNPSVIRRLDWTIDRIPPQPLFQPEESDWLSRIPDEASLQQSSPDEVMSNTPALGSPSSSIASTLPTPSTLSKPVGESVSLTQPSKEARTVELSDQPLEPRTVPDNAEPATETLPQSFEIGTDGRAGLSDPAATPSPLMNCRVDQARVACDNVTRSPDENAKREASGREELQRMEDEIQALYSVIRARTFRARPILRVVKRPELEYVMPGVMFSAYAFESHPHASGTSTIRPYRLKSAQPRTLLSTDGSKLDHAKAEVWQRASVGTRAAKSVTYDFADDKNKLVLMLLANGQPYVGERSLFVRGREEGVTIEDVRAIVVGRFEREPDRVTGMTVGVSKRWADKPRALVVLARSGTATTDPYIPRSINELSSST